MCKPAVSVQLFKASFSVGTYTNYCLYGVRFMVFNATFNNISVILWQSVLLVEETGVPGESHNVVSNSQL